MRLPYALPIFRFLLPVEMLFGAVLGSVFLHRLDVNIQACVDYVYLARRIRRSLLRRRLRKEAET